MLQEPRTRLLHRRGRRTGGVDQPWQSTLGSRKVVHEDTDRVQKTGAVAA